MVRIGVLSLAVGAQFADAQSTMRAGALVKMPTDGHVHLEDLQEVEVPAPGSPSATQVRIQVAGSSVNPVDWKLIKGDYANTGLILMSLAAIVRAQCLKWAQACLG